MVKKLNPLDVLALYNQNLNSVEISKLLKVSAVSIRYWFKKLNLKTQSLSEASRKYTINHDFFEKIDSPEKAYILGLLAADGCNYRKKEIVVVLSLIDYDIIKKINNLISPDKPIKKIKTKSNYVYRIDMRSHKISNDLLNYGIIPNKSLTLEFCNNIPNNYLSSYIRGYFDGDGSACLRQKTLSVIFMGTFSFLTSLKNILLDKFNLKLNKIVKHCKSNVYYLSFSSRKDVIQLYNFLYEDNTEFFIKRKKDKFKEWKMLHNIND